MKAENRPGFPEGVTKTAERRRGETDVTHTGPIFHCIRKTKTEKKEEESGKMCDFHGKNLRQFSSHGFFVCLGG